MKPNDKAIDAARKVVIQRATHNFFNPSFLFGVIEAALDAAYAAQFKSEDYAGLLERLRKDISDKLMSDWDSWRKYISDGGDGSWPRDQFEGHLDAIAEMQHSAADAIEALLAEREALNFELAARKEWPQAQAEMLEELAKVRAERYALAARLAPVGDDELLEIAADAICASLPSLRWVDLEAGARASIAAIRPHIEAAERERCAKIAETPDLWVTDKPSRGCDDIAAAIRSGK